MVENRPPDGHHSQDDPVVVPFWRHCEHGVLVDQKAEPPLVAVFFVAVIEELCVVQVGAFLGSQTQSMQE